MGFSSNCDVSFLYMLHGVSRELAKAIAIICDHSFLIDIGNNYWMYFLEANAMDMKIWCDGNNVRVWGQLTSLCKGRINNNISYLTYTKPYINRSGDILKDFQVSGTQPCSYPLEAWAYRCIDFLICSTDNVPYILGEFFTFTISNDIHNPETTRHILPLAGKLSL